MADRDQLIRSLRRNGISDETVLAAMASVPRDKFVPEPERAAAWEDHPLPIGSGQTISQPFVVAYMTQQLNVRAGDRVLDVGTGCGYQAAVLCACGAQVSSVEVRPELADHARATLAELGYDVTVVCGDGHLGLPESAPFDAILVAAATDTVPQALLDQLREPAAARSGGRLILPLSGGGLWPEDQQLVRFQRAEHGWQRENLIGVRFVPLIEPS